MKRGIILLLAITSLAVVSMMVVFSLTKPHKEPSEWLEKEFSLPRDRAQQVKAMNRDYAAVCARLCERIRESDERLTDVLATSDQMTPAVREALAETDNVRTECRTQMLAHFYEVAAVMPQSERERYLKMVYPLIQRPEEMNAHQFMSGGH